MIITCPACDAQYLLPDESIGQKGRRVKCTTCDYTWLQMPEMVLASEEDFTENHFSDILSNVSANEAVPEAPVFANRATPVVRTRSDVVPVVLYGTFLAFFLVMLTLATATGNRYALVREYPATSRLFEAIGFPVEIPAQAIEISDVKARIIQNGKGKDMLAVSGLLTNNGTDEAKLPRLVIRLNGENGWLKDWSDSLYGQNLGAGQSTRFDYQLTHVPSKARSDARDVTVLFAD